MRGANLILCLSLIFVLSCSRSHEEISGINWDAWKSDRNGCNKQRIEYLSSLSEQVDKLKARSEMEIVELMGRPDETELYKRNQKFYTYFFRGSSACQEADSASSKLVIRFNAMGLAKDVEVE